MRTPRRPAGDTLCIRERGLWPLRRSSRVPRAGYTLIELVFAVGLTVVLAGTATPIWSNATDRARALAAARYVAARLQYVRMEAVKRSAYVGVRFLRESTGAYRMTLFADGNGNGLRAADIGRGIDEAIQPDDRLEDRFAGVRFGVLDGVVEMDSPALLSPDPIQIGRTDLVSFSPAGTATSGTLYISGRGNRQLAVRILGATGRVRVLEYHADSTRWEVP